MTIGRRVLGILAGVLAAGLVVALAEAVGHAAATEPMVFGVVVIGYGLGSLAGTVTTVAIADRRTAIAVPLILAVLAAINLFSFPHPLWFAPVAAAALALGWWVGAHLVLRRPLDPGSPR